MTGESLVEFDESDPDAATGTQPLCFIEHSAHDMRIGYYRDTYVRTETGWRLRTRAMTFIRRSGVHDSGRPHAIGRPGCREWSTASSGRLEGLARRQRPDPRPGSFAARPHRADSPGSAGRCTTPAGCATAGPRSRRPGRSGDVAAGRRRGGARPQLAEPGPYSMMEVLVPTMISYARPELAAEMVPRYLRGEEPWCQGFSEPGSGSDLASLTTKATQRGDDWVINGQKVWTSFAQFSKRCVLLTRTGSPGPQARGHHGLLRRHGHTGYHGAAAAHHARRRRVL